MGRLGRQRRKGLLSPSLQKQQPKKSEDLADQRTPTFRHYNTLYDVQGPAIIDYDAARETLQQLQRRIQLQQDQAELVPINIGLDTLDTF